MFGASGVGLEGDNQQYSGLPTRPATPPAEAPAAPFGMIAMTHALPTALPPRGNLPPPPAPRPEVLGTATALYDLHGEQDGDLSFHKGDVIELLDTSLSWWKGKVADRVGVFPSNYVRRNDA